VSNGAPNPYVLRLEKLEATVREQAEQIAALKGTLAAVAAAFGGGAASGSGAATDRELDHPQHGDPEVKLIPRDGVGMGVLKGQKFSRCSADFLEILAESYDWFATKNDEKGEKDGKGNPKSMWDRKTARLARGWARRLRSGWTPPPAPEKPSFGGDGGGFGSGSGGAPFGAGTTRSWGSDGTSSNGHRGFLGAAPPAAPAPTDSGLDPDPDGFDFGANVGKPTTAATPTTEEIDDDPPLPI
jgi:hypothetical protein